MFIFSVAWISVEAFEFLCGQNQESWADRKLKQVLTLFFHTVPSLSSSTYTDTNSGFPSNFILLLFHFFLPLSLHSTKILRRFGKSTSLWLSPGCVCGCAPVWGLLGLSWKEKDHSVPNQSAASSRSLSRASRLRAHLHFSLMTQTLFRWHHAEYKMSI